MDYNKQDLFMHLFSLLFLALLLATVANADTTHVLKSGTAIVIVNPKPDTVRAYCRDKLRVIQITLTKDGKAFCGTYN